MTSQEQSQTTTGPQTSEFTEHERDVTGYVFVRMKAVWPSKFDLIWPTEKELKLTKREYAKDFGKYSRKKIDEAIAYCKSEVLKSTDGYLEPSPLVLLRVLGQLNTSKAMYQCDAPKLPEPPEHLSRRKRAAATGIERLKGIFDE